MPNDRNPLGPLIDKVEQLEDVGLDYAVSAVKYGGRQLARIAGVGKGATRFAVDTAKKPVDATADAAENVLGLTKATIKNLGNFASGLLPALGDRNPDKPDNE